ncbi:MAG: hypothetical protein WCF12_04055 [Propionicimonas sp.]
MAQSAFAVHLGGGLYLDSDGSLTQGPPDSAAMYEAPFKLPIDPKTAKDAMESVQKALKDINKDPKVLAKFAEYGFDYKILDLLSGVAKIAGIVAPVLAVLAIAYDLLRIFGVFKNGPSAFEELVKQRFDELEENVESIKTMLHIQDIRNGRLGVENFLADASTYSDQLKNTNPSVVQLESDLQRLLQLEHSKADAVALLLDQATWISNFDRDEYTRVWPLLQGILHTMPGAVGTAPLRANLPPDGSTPFDHRLMVPLACYAATAYLTCIRAIVPEYRSTGQFHAKLRQFSVKLDELAQAMRTNGLARTVYRPADFSWPVYLGSHEVELVQFLPPTFKVAPGCNRFPVGAMDLRYHDDRYFGPFLDGLWRAEFLLQPYPTKHGGMDFRWVPPAQLAPGPFDNTWVITNPQECADAANAQSAKDYADLLSVSGYTELLRLATLLRSESTEPNRSQTVSAGKPDLYRNPEPSTAVTIQSPSIFGTGVITSPATREPQACLAMLQAGTQPIKRARPAHYKVLLRTLRAPALGHYSLPDYAAYHRPFYARDLGDPRFMTLDIFQSDSALDQELLISGSSPRDATEHRQGIAKLKANTFDWWIPVKPPFNIDVDFATTMAALRAVGWSQRVGAAQALPGFPPLFTQQVVPATIRSHTPSTGSTEIVSTHLDLIPSLFWRDGDQDWDGQTRDPKEAEITIEYTLDWAGDRLALQIKNDPADRNYVVFLVIEETLDRTGQILHTAMPIPVNGQLTYVPQQYFDDESAAWGRAAKAIRDLNRRFSEVNIQIGPNPPDPVIGWLRPGDLATAASIQRFIALAEQHQPQLLRDVVADGRLAST